MRAVEERQWALIQIDLKVTNEHHLALATDRHFEMVGGEGGDGRGSAQQKMGQPIVGFTMASSRTINYYKLST